MPDSYLLTAERMEKSSRSLHDSSEFFNSCYLAGYVVECYMKLIHKVMIGNDARKSHALSTLKAEFDSQFAYIISSSTLAQSLNKTGIVLDVTTKCAQILASWDPFYRYSDSISWDGPMSEIYQQEANECAKIIGRMKSAGLIS